MRASGNLLATVFRKGTESLLPCVPAESRVTSKCYHLSDQLRCVCSSFGWAFGKAKMKSLDANMSLVASGERVWNDFWRRCFHEVDIRLEG